MTIPEARYLWLWLRVVAVRGCHYTPEYMTIPEARYLWLWLRVVAVRGCHYTPEYMSIPEVTRHARLKVRVVDGQRLRLHTKRQHNT